MIRFRVLLLSACVLAICALLPPPCAAEEVHDGWVTVGYYENEIFQEGARPGAYKSGYAYEYYRKLSEYTGWRYKYVYGSFGDLYELFLAGKIDLLAGLAHRPERESQMLYPEFPMGNETLSLLKHEDDEGITASYSSMTGRSIGVLNSAMIARLRDFLSKHGIEARIVPFDAYDDLFAAFDAKEVDMLAAEGDGAYGRSHTEVLCQFGVTDYYLCVRAGGADLLRQLNEAQTQLFSDDPNFINSLRGKFYPVSVSSRSFSHAEKQWLGEHDVIRVGYLEDYLPFSATAPDGSVDGLVKDIMEEMLVALEISGIRVEYTGYGSSEQMGRALADGSIDTGFPVGGGLYFTEENGLHQSKPVLSATCQIVYKAGAPADGRKDVFSHFAVNKNNKMQYYYVLREFPDAQISFYSSMDDCLTAIVTGDVSCTSMNAFRTDMLKNRKYRSLSIRQGPAGDDRCFGVRFGNEGLLRLLNRGLGIVGMDYARNLAYQYGEKLYVYSAEDFTRDHMGIFVALLTLVSAVIIYLLVREALLSKKALAAAEKANVSKTTFLNSMSHDIRTPMNAIVGFTALASSHLDDRKLVGEYLDRISVSSQHLLSLLNDVLDMSRIESGNVILNEGELNLGTLIEDIKTIVNADISARKQELSVMQSIAHEDVIGDKLRLNQVLLNIISNAMKYTPEGGRIEVCVRELGSPVNSVADFQFRITDNGIGMSEEFQKVVFEAFTRESTTTVNRIQGTGLGMAITKKIVDMMGGSISVQSTQGVGSEFTVVVPLRISRSPAALPEQAGEEAAGKGGIRFEGKRILLVEDTETNQMIAEAILTGVGLEVEIAGDGAIALDMMESRPAGYYDLVLMDIQMPNMDGYEATRRIRSMGDPSKAGIPIIALTANAFGEDRAKAFEAGMNEHLAKPYDIPKVMEMLRRFL